MCDCTQRALSLVPTSSAPVRRSGEELETPVGMDQPIQASLGSGD